VDTPTATTNLLPLRLLVQFQQRCPDTEPELVLQAPGRDLWMMAMLNTSGRVALASVELNARTVLSAHSARYKRTMLHRPLPKWSRYAAGVLISLDDSNLTVSGLTAVVGGDEPVGPRYEYTLGVLMAGLIYTVNQQSFTHSKLFEIADRARRDYVENR